MGMVCTVILNDSLPFRAPPPDYRRGVSTILSLGTGDAMNESGGEARSNLSYAMTALELATESHRASARMETMTKIVRLMAVNEVRAVSWCFPGVCVLLTSVL